MKYTIRHLLFLPEGRTKCAAFFMSMIIICGCHSFQSFLFFFIGPGKPYFNQCVYPSVCVRAGVSESQSENESESDNVFVCVPASVCTC